MAGSLLLGLGLTPATSLMPILVTDHFGGGALELGWITNGPFFSIIQASVDPGMQGRVFALVQSMAAAATRIGMVIAGPVADALGVRLWYSVGGVGCVLMGAGGFFIPAIVHLEDDRAASASETRPAGPVAGGCADAPRAH